MDRRSADESGSSSSLDWEGEADAALAIANAESHRTRGDLAEAVRWYQMAAEHLSDAGQHARSAEMLKRASELTALDNVGRPASMMVSPEAVAEQIPMGGTADAPDLVLDDVEAMPSRVSAPGRANKSAGGGSLPRVAAQRPPGSSTRPGQSVPTGKRVIGKLGTNPATGTVLRGSSASVGAPSLPRRDPAEATIPTPSPEVLPVRVLDLEESDSLESLLSDVDPEAASYVTNSGSSNSIYARLLQTVERASEAVRLLQRLPSLPLFSKVPMERLSQLAREVGVVRCVEDEALCTLGEPEGPMFVVSEGTAEVLLPGDSTRGIIVKPGDVVGEAAALYGGPRMASLRALGPLEALSFPPSLVRQLARECPPFHHGLRDTVFDRAMVSLPRSSAILRRLDAELRERVFARFELVEHNEGDVLLIAGELARALYIVVAGEVELYGAGHAPTRSHHARAGDAFGVLSSLTSRASGVTARAWRAAIVARLPREDVAAFARDSKTWASMVDIVGAPGSGIMC